MPFLCFAVIQKDTSNRIRTTSREKRSCNMGDEHNNQLKEGTQKTQRKGVEDGKESAGSNNTALGKEQTGRQANPPVAETPNL
jgi:hypothetical protein